MTADDLSACLVLLVDDVKDNINVLVEALKNDYKLGFALDGESAIKYARARQPDLILLDIMMPGLDGYEVCRRLKADHALREIPVLFITAMQDVEDKAAGFAVGAVDYITKPFEIVEVKARVKTHLALQMARQELKKQRDRMQQSLDLAMEVQQSLLPRQNPEVDRLDVAGVSIYCDETGGDYFDFPAFGSSETERLGVVVGDVSEHGIPSALLMTTARALIRQRAEMGGDLGLIMTDVNRQLARDVGDSGRFMSLFCAELDAREMKIRWSNAGHDPALIYNPNADSFIELPGRGPALGIVEEFSYQEADTPLSPGEIFALGTDGIWESHNSDGEMFGKEAFQEVIRRNWKLSAEEIVRSVIDAVNRFNRSKRYEDDVTLVVVKVDPAG